MTDEHLSSNTVISEVVTGHHRFVGRDVPEQVAREAELARKT